MKIILALFILLTSTAFAFEKVKINGKLYVADGFDDNDLVELTVAGVLPNSCYKNPYFEIVRNGSNYEVRLFAHYVPAVDGCRDVSMSNDSNREIELVGVNPVNCLEFDKVISEVQNSMIVIKPQFKEVGACENKQTSFKIKYKVPYLPNQPKAILLHVRVMNGRSYSYLYQNRL